MSQPVELERDLQDLENLPESKLRPKFREEADNATSKIFKKVSPKQVNGELITGEMLYHLATSYVEAINQGTGINIESAWNYMCKEKVDNTANNCLKEMGDIVQSSAI